MKIIKNVKNREKREKSESEKRIDGARKIKLQCDKIVRLIVIVRTKIWQKKKVKISELSMTGRRVGHLSTWIVLGGISGLPLVAHQPTGWT